MTKQWILDAVSYWSPRVYEGDIGCDWDEADVRCWRCGHRRSCQKCHIVPKMLGGSDDSSNIIPLCAECHDEMPNVADPPEVWRWIAADHGILHDTYWPQRGLAMSGLSADDLKRFTKKKFAEASKKCGLHFGQLTGRARITPATTAWVLREACRSTKRGKQ